MVLFKWCTIIVLGQSTWNSGFLHDSEEEPAIIRVCVCVCVCPTFSLHFANLIEKQEEVIRTARTGGQGPQLCSGAGVERDAD